MNYSEAKEKLEKYGQQQLLRFYDELSEEEAQALLAEINKIDFSVLEGKEKDISTSVFTPLKALTAEEIEKRKDSFFEKGIEAIRQGKLACVLLAGGQGTRLGFDGPKGTLNVGVTKELYLFEMLINNAKEVAAKAGCAFPIYIMTSEKNNAATVRFFNEHNFFGYDKNMIHFFIQEMSPATDYDHKVYLEGKGHVSLSPNGNGGWYRSLRLNGLYDDIKAQGIEWFNVFGVDNGLQKVADPYFLGAVLESGDDLGAKVIKKAFPTEGLGVICYRDGKPSIVEYYDLTDEMLEAKDENGELAYNFGVILNYLFNIEALEKIAGENLPLHIVKKKIPHLDEAGNLIKPEEPNGYKYETLVLDMIEMMDNCLVYEVIREKEFAPIKNLHGVDSLDSARELYAKNNIEL
ncbi:MAG: UDPGP type 1 family protein [Lachnospiraceae bacterium]|nr:UDPGP type 1 family protein [Lachnospiraceae bacterium]